MTITFLAGDQPPEDLAAVDLIAVADKYFQDAAVELSRTIARINAGALAEAKTAVAAVRELKIAFHTAMIERGNVDKLRKHVTGTVGASALDLHAARDEIGRRLARLRDAGAG